MLLYVMIELKIIFMWW